MLPSYSQAWTAADVEQLLVARPKEDRSRDYKRELHKNPDDLLADVSAFANTYGGVILFGIEEVDGEPDKVVSLNVASQDKETLRLSSIIETNLDPPLRGCAFDWISTNDGNLVLALRIPQSGIAPHRIKKGTPKFYSRGEAGNSPMDTYDLRNAFLGQGQSAARFREFVALRCSFILEETTPFPFSPSPFAVFHAMPIRATARPDDISMSDLYRKAEELTAPFTMMGERKVCLDGVAILGGAPGGYGSGTLLFRNGSLEIVIPCEHATQLGTAVNPTVFQYLANDISEYFECHGDLGVSGPWMVSLAFVRCAGLKMSTHALTVLQSSGEIRKDYFPLPILDYVDDTLPWNRVAQILADRLANHFGAVKSPYFTAEGEYRRDRYW